MIQLSKKMLTFVPSVEKDWQHRGERLSFDPSENLENSCSMGKSLKAASPAVAFILLDSCVESAHINTCRCELIFILYATGIPEPSDKECQEGSHSL
jgi:hypothetical protein